MKTKIHALIPQDYPELYILWNNFIESNHISQMYFFVGIRKYDKLFRKICQTNGLDPETEIKRKSEIFFKNHKIIPTGRIGIKMTHD